MWSTILISSTPDILFSVYVKTGTLSATGCTQDTRRSEIHGRPVMPIEGKKVRWEKNNSKSKCKKLLGKK